MHVERRGVGEDFAASLHRTQDVGPHFGQLRDGGFNDLPGLYRRLPAGPRSAAAARFTRCGGGHVGVEWSGELSTLAQPPSCSSERRRSGTRTLFCFFCVAVLRNLLPGAPSHGSLATAFGFSQLTLMSFMFMLLDGGAI